MQSGFRDNQIFGEGFGVDSDSWSESGYKELRTKYMDAKRGGVSPVGAVLDKDPEEMVGPAVERKVMQLKPLVGNQASRLCAIVLDAYNNDIKNLSKSD